MAKKVKKLEDVKPEETTEAIEEVIETSNDVEEEREVVECSHVEETTEAPTELPKVEFNEEVAPKGFSSLITPQKKQEELKMKNGRIYKEIGNGLGMFLDNGGTFRI